MGGGLWQRVGERDNASWYLHPLVAVQKRQIHMELTARWTAGFTAGRVLKTDLFEEAFGDDVFFVSAFPAGTWMAGMDTAEATVRRARARQRELRFALATDARRIGLRSESIDLIISNSTLDHFDTEGEFLAALAELERILRPGGRLILTLDNPANPLYPPLRWMSRRGWAPFPLGYTPQTATLERALTKLGLRVREQDWLIHNPRLLSTAIFQALDRLTGRRGDSLARGLLAVFARLGDTPLKRWSACFNAYCVEKPVTGGRRESGAC